MMAHVKVVDLWGEGKPAPIPPDAKTRANSGGEMFDPLFATVCVHDYRLIRVPQPDDDKAALITSACPVSDNHRLLGP